MSATEAILSIDALSSGYGELPVLQGITLEVGRGEIVSVVGANGAGKTTLLLTISGHLRAFSGKVKFDGHDISHIPAHAAAEMGLVMVPEGRRLFPFMTVLENLELGAFHPVARAQLQNINAIGRRVIRSAVHKSTGYRAITVFMGIFKNRHCNAVFDGSDQPVRDGGYGCGKSGGINRRWRTPLPDS